MKICVYIYTHIGGLDTGDDMYNIPYPILLNDCWLMVIGSLYYSIYLGL